MSAAQIFFNFGPLGVSSITQPLAFNSSRIASARLKSFAFPRLVRLRASARISAGNFTFRFLCRCQERNQHFPKRPTRRQLRLRLKNFRHTAIGFTDPFKYHCPCGGNFRSSSSAAAKSLKLIQSAGLLSRLWTFSGTFVPVPDCLSSFRATCRRIHQSAPAPCARPANLRA